MCFSVSFSKNFDSLLFEGAEEMQEEIWEIKQIHPAEWNLDAKINE